MTTSHNMNTEIIYNLISYRYKFEIVDMEDHIKLDVLTPEITGEICADRCGSRCCNFIASDHYVPIELVDYANLSRLNLEHFVTFYSTVERPQLLNKPSGDCVFLNKEGLCSIYEFRPLACRKYPYRENEDDVADLPDWCELHNRSSTKLKLERINLAKELNDHYDRLESKIAYDPLMDYLQRDKGHEIYQLPDFFEEWNTNSDEEYWRVYAITEDLLEVVKNRISEIKKELQLDWTIIRLIVFNDDLEIIGMIDGTVRENEELQLPYFEDFPPTDKEFKMLLNVITSTDDYEEHLYGGALLPEKTYDIIANRKTKTNPINSEYP